MADHLQTSSWDTTSKTTARSFSNLLLKGKEQQALCANETDQVVTLTKTVAPRINLTVKMVDLYLPHRRKKWSRSSVYRRKSLSSDWSVFRKNMRKSKRCKKKKKTTDLSKYVWWKEGIATWKARKPNCTNTKSTGLSTSVKPIWCCKRVNARWPLTRPRDELVAPTSNKNS